VAGKLPQKKGKGGGGGKGVGGGREKGGGGGGGGARGDLMLSMMTQIHKEPEFSTKIQRSVLQQNLQPFFFPYFILQ